MWAPGVGDGVEAFREKCDQNAVSQPRWGFLRYKEIHWAGVSFSVEDTEPQGTPTAPHRTP